MVGFGSGGSFLRQFSGKDRFNSSKRWSKKGPERSIKHMEGLNMMNGDNGVVLRKRMMVVVGISSHLMLAEHQTFGPGATPDKRVEWSRQLSDEEAAQFTSIDYVDGKGWLPAYH